MARSNAALVLSIIAVFIALSGASYAALTLPKNSVTSKQVKDHSLLKRDFRSGQIPRGAQGPEGPQGAQGAQGTQGPPGPTNTSALVRVNGPSTPVCPTGNSCAVATSAAVCPAGMKVVSGGFFNFTGGTEGEFSDASGDRTAWTAGVANGSTYGGGNIQAFAYCATTGAAVTARTRGLSARTRRELAQRARALRRLLAQP